jgi:hypothetical protein
MRAFPEHHPASTSRSMNTRDDARGSAHVQITRRKLRVFVSSRSAS